MDECGKESLLGMDACYVNECSTMRRKKKSKKIQVLATITTEQRLPKTKQNKQKANKQTKRHRVRCSLPAISSSTAASSSMSKRSDRMRASDTNCCVKRCLFCMPCTCKPSVVALVTKSLAAAFLALKGQ